MSTEGYAQFLANMGHNVRRENDCYWFDAHPHIYMSFPFQKLILSDSVNWLKVFDSDGWAARFPCDIAQGRKSYRIIINQSDYDFDNLSGKARNQTRRGLENCEVREVTFQELFEHGMLLNIETLKRQGRLPSTTFEDDWNKYYKHAAMAEGGHAWGAFYEGVLVAYLIAFIMEDVSHILIVRSSRKFLKKYPNNALIYSYLYNILRSGRVREISIGMESIQEGMGSLDHFKKGMGFKKEIIGQQIILRPIIAKFVTKSTIRIGNYICSHLPENEKMSKLSGLLRWYSEQL